MNHATDFKPSLHHMCLIKQLFKLYLRHANKRQPLLIDYLFLMCALWLLFAVSLFSIRENIFVCLFPKHHSLPFFAPKESSPQQMIKKLTKKKDLKHELPQFISTRCLIQLQNIILQSNWMMIALRQKELLNAPWETLFWHSLFRLYKDN